jgi:penicillin-binding protein 1A
VNLLELVNSYSTIIDDGRMHEPVLVERIVDRDGNEIYRAPTQGRQAVPYRSAFFVQQLLKAGLQERGATSMSLWGYVRNFPDTEFGGKTGTSNNHSDAWFVGVSPRLVCGAWVGGEYRSRHFRTGALGQGSRTALPICGYFYESVLSDPAFKHYRTKFAPPRDASIQASEYQGGTYVHSYRDSDSLATDSLATFEIEQQEVELDEEGNPVIGPKSRETDNNSEKTATDEPNGEATEPKP